MSKQDLTWYRRYRPERVADLHIKEVREGLQFLLKKGKIPQALLFAGPKGTGKTSASRIIGAILNDEINAAVVDYVYFSKGSKPVKLELAEPNVESSENQQIYAGRSFVVQEMDAASNRRIDDIRTLQDRVQLPPAVGRISVYILDEVHMLTNEAFNALLKLLEEPPAHVVFILATTEKHKLPATILSRATTINFRRATDDEIKAVLQKIATSEKIETTDDLLMQIVNRADGSFRDAVKLFEQVAGNGKIDEAALARLGDQELVTSVVKLCQAVIAKNEVEVITQIQAWREQNLAPEIIYKEMFTLLHQSILAEITGEGKIVFKRPIAEFLLNHLLKSNLFQVSPIPYLPLELSLLDLINKAKQKTGGSTAVTTPKSVPVAKNTTSLSSEKLEAMPITAIRETAPIKLETISSNSPKITSQKLIDNWDKFIEQVAAKNPSIASLLRSSKPNQEKSAEIATIDVYYPFHLEKLNQRVNLDLFGQCCEVLLGGVADLQFILAKNEKSDSQIAVEALM